MVRFPASADGSQQIYALYAPPGLVVNRRYPLVISLHGEEASPQLNLRQLLGSKLLRVDPSDPRMYPVARETEYFAAFPLARGTFGYRGIVERDVYDVLEDVERRNPIDRDRVYLTGIGMGGGGALWYALTRPDVWAAVAPLAPEPIPGTEELARNALNLPVRLFQGDQDPIAPVAASRLWHRLLLDAGGPAEYFEFPGVRHNAWDYAYKSGAIFEWFNQFRRQQYPQRVNFTTRSYRYSSAYWVRIDGLTPGDLATIDARQEGSGIRVETTGIDGFTVTLDHAIDAATIDGWTVKMKPGTEQSFTRVASRWRAGRFTPPGKRPGAEGPIAAAFDGGQVYVYGTQSARDDLDIEERKRAADRTAHWGTLNFPVHSDEEEARTTGAAHHVVLFGTRQTNSILRGLDLPLELNAGAADYGLLFVAPAGRGQYVVVSSGLPWWTGAQEANRGGDRFAPEPYRLLETFGDFILFKHSLANVVCQGRFDNEWSVRPEDAAKLESSGTVTVRPSRR
jgi:pimeloyl-ACP methyl ester carboxylesterase